MPSDAKKLSRYSIEQTGPSYESKTESAGQDSFAVDEVEESLRWEKGCRASAPVPRAVDIGVFLQ